MAKIVLNSALRQIAGEIDGYVYKKFQGRSILAKKPVFAHRVWTASHREGHDRFREANAYARAVYADPRQKAFYVKLARKRKAWRAYALATADYLNPPEIRRIDVSNYRGCPGDRIGIDAWDDGEVTRVEVRLRTPAGRVVEEGLAGPGYNGGWDYQLVHAQPAGVERELEVVAVDRPGNRTMRWQKLAVPSRKRK